MSEEKKETDIREVVESVRLAMKTSNSVLTDFRKNSRMAFLASHTDSVALTEASAALGDAISAIRAAVAHLAVCARELDLAHKDAAEKFAELRENLAKNRPPSEVN